MGRNVPKMNYNDKFTFGKHKGKTIEDLIHDELQYITWCIEEEIFELDCYAQERYDEIDAEQGGGGRYRR